MTDTVQGGPTFGSEKKEEVHLQANQNTPKKENSGVTQNTESGLPNHSWKQKRG